MSTPEIASVTPFASVLGRTVFDACVEGIVILNPDGNVLGANREFCRLYELDPSQVVGRHYLDFSRRIEVRRLGAKVDSDLWISTRALRGEVVSGVDQFVRHLDSGTEFVGRYSSHPVYEEGQLTAALIMVLDITEMSRAKESLQGALSASEVATWRVDFHTNRIFGDTNFATIHGFQLSDSEGMPLSQIYDSVHPSDMAEVVRVLAETRISGRPHEVEYRITLSDGTTRWLLNRGRVELDATGTAISRLGTVVDVTKQKQAEEQADRLADRYRALSEASASVVFVTDEAGSIVEVPLARGVFARDRREVRTLGWIVHVHPDDRQEALRLWQEAISNGADYDAEFRLHMADDTYRWHSARGVRVLDGEGAVREWVGALTDIHEQVSKERSVTALHDFSEQTRGLLKPEAVMGAVQSLVGKRLNPSRVAYSEVDEDGTFKGVPNWCDGCEDLDGKYPISGFASHVSGHLRSGEHLVIHDVSTAASDLEGLDRLAGAGISALICIPLLRNSRIVAILGVHSNRPRIWSSDEVELVRSMAEMGWAETERVRIQRGLQLSEKRLQLILEAATIGVVVNNVEGKFLYTNGALLAALKFERADLEAGLISWSVIQDPALKPLDDVALEQLRASGTCTPFETELLAKDGSRVPVYIGASLVPDGTGHGQLGAVFISDLTKIKAHEEELRSLTRELDERVRVRTEELTRANRDLNEFSYTVAHDLRAPLRAIVSTSRLLIESLGEKLDDDERRMLNRQATNGVRLARLIDDLLSFARLANAELNREEFSLSHLAEYVGDDVLSRWTHGCTIQVQAGMRASGDQNLIGYALTNLLDNACKFSPSGGIVEVGRTEQAFYVRDHGIGFDMRHADKLFVAFERLVDQEKFPGTGVGLANVKRLIERHGGSVWAESAPGAGATFWFSLG